VNVAAGTLQLQTNLGTSDAGTVQLQLTGGTTAISAPQHLASLDLTGGSATVAAGGANTIKTKSLTAATGSIDLSNNDMVIDYTGTSSQIGGWASFKYTGVTGYIATGRNGGAWSGVGIRTSQPAAQSSAGALTTLGIGEASAVLGLQDGATTTWSGQTVDATSVLVKYTYAGDANLDGRINGDDYFYIDSGYADRATGFAWGDFDYSGSVTSNDYFLIDHSFLNQDAALIPASAGGVVPVPEPASAFAAFSGIGIFAASRRRCRRGREGVTFPNRRPPA
jgi:hypothetical protein